METIQKVLRRAQRVANARPISSSAIALGVGAPVVAIASLAVSVLVNMFVFSRFESETVAHGGWFWLLLPLIAVTPLWLLVSWVLGRGGWRGVGSGVALIIVFGLCALLLGWVEQWLDPGNDMSGVGWVILVALLSMLAPFVLLIAGLVAAVRQLKSGVRTPA